MVTGRRAGTTDILTGNVLPPIRATINNSRTSIGHGFLFRRTLGTILNECRDPYVARSMGKPNIGSNSHFSSIVLTAVPSVRTRIYRML